MTRCSCFDLDRFFDPRDYADSDKRNRVQLSDLCDAAVKDVEMIRALVSPYEGHRLSRNENRRVSAALYRLFRQHGLSYSVIDRLVPCGDVKARISNVFRRTCLSDSTCIFAPYLFKEIVP